jgi:hypothetical protein
MPIFYKRDNKISEKVNRELNYIDLNIKTTYK